MTEYWVLSWNNIYIYIYTHSYCYDWLLGVNKSITQPGDMSATQMYPSLWGGFRWFSVHEDRQGAYYGCCCRSLLYQLSSWLIFSLGKSIILVRGESPTTHIYVHIHAYTQICIYIFGHTYVHIYTLIHAYTVTRIHTYIHVLNI